MAKSTYFMIIVADTEAHLREIANLPELFKHIIKEPDDSFNLYKSNVRKTVLPGGVHMEMINMDSTNTLSEEDLNATYVVTSKDYLDDDLLHATFTALLNMPPWLPIPNNVLTTIVETERYSMLRVAIRPPNADIVQPNKLH